MTDIDTKRLRMLHEEATTCAGPHPDEAAREVEASVSALLDAVDERDRLRERVTKLEADPLIGARLAVLSLVGKDCNHGSGQASEGRGSMAPQRSPVEGQPQGPDSLQHDIGANDSASASLHGVAATEAEVGRLRSALSAVIDRLPPHGQEQARREFAELIGETGE